MRIPQGPWLMEICLPAHHTFKLRNPETKKKTNKTKSSIKWERKASVGKNMVEHYLTGNHSLNGKNQG